MMKFHQTVVEIKFDDSEKTKDTKSIMNALYRENEQRNLYN